MGINDKLNAIADDVGEIKALLNGPQGLVVRVDRLEQSASRRRWISRTAIAAAIASVLDVVQRHVIR